MIASEGAGEDEFKWAREALDRSAAEQPGASAEPWPWVLV